VPLIQPFRALRPARGRAAEVLAPPYDVLSSAEARERARGKPWSFLHISKPEIDLDPSIDVHDPKVYAKAAENLRRQTEAGVLIRDTQPAYYAYRLTREGRTQTGLACVASIADYETNRIRKHELTTPVKEDDRVHQIEAINAQTGPVMMGYRDTPALDAALATATRGKSDIDVTADDGVRHEMWPIADAGAIARITEPGEALPAIYLADGHHRSAAASRVARARGNRGSAAWFLSVLFPEREMLILDYNRVLKTLNGQSPAALLAALGKQFAVAPSPGPVRPNASNEFGMYMAGHWYRLMLRRELVPADPVGRLPVTLLSENVLVPFFGVTDQRSDKRIDFVGGGRGLAELARRVDSGEMAVAFALYPTRMADLMAVADAGKIMPPKSTWFEPKLADGVVSHVLD
jgi:uncharacterized protein (DUF1015 family)